jgi:hypothetical protein
MLARHHNPLMLTSQYISSTGRANGEVMGKSLIDYTITTPDVAMPCDAAAGPTATVGRN